MCKIIFSGSLKKSAFRLYRHKAVYFAFRLRFVMDKEKVFQKNFTQFEKKLNGN
ncbi:MAG: hypothetical protein IJV35_11215 [Neisseriaceae bacterium]|nr:hypothetical protein [Neisseriaceae bacterium]MBQ9683821.1 hypothetical protein [Neisseriaceae bacterium]MBQ9725413.1 hypothetical protein [Neisseriaceae bacterium]